MQIDITARGEMEITDSLRERTIEKFTHHFQRYTRITRIHVIYEVHKQNQIIKAHLHIPGADIDATAESKKMYDSIDSVIDKLIAQIDSHKSKVTDHHSHRSNKNNED